MNYSREITQFFTDMYHGLHDGYIVIWERENKSSRYIPVNQPELIADYAIHLSSSTDVYYGLGVQKAKNGSGRGVENDVIAIPALWVDIDCSFGNHSADNIIGSLEEIQQLLIDYPLASYIIASGGGYHLYWLFHEPWKFETVDEAKHLIRGFQNGIKKLFADNGYLVDSTFDLARVLRVPYTYNHKSSPAIPVTIIEGNDYRYTPNELSSYVLETPIKPSNAKSNGTRRITVQEALEMLSYIPKRLEYSQWLAILMALYNELGTDKAIELGELWSSGYEGEIEEKIRSFEGRDYDVTAGTLVYYARQYGWKPSVYEYEPLPVDIVQNQKYVRFEKIKDTVLLVKSQKGTGKTEQLLEIVDEVRANGGKVLLVGHRIALLRSTAERLQLDFYLTQENLDKSNGLAITLDSLYKLPIDASYDLILVDESEQVLTHATGSTLRETRGLCMSLLRSFFNNARHIVALDADMGRITYNYFEREINKPIRVLINEYQPKDKTFYIFDKKPAFIHSMMTDIQAGNKLFVAANSKQAVNTLQKMIEDRFPELRIKNITADNSLEDETQIFLSSINSSLENYDLLIVSPSVGTGVSIDALYFDTVYLLGEMDITTHLDLLQQAARVRNIKSNNVYCWINDKPNFDPCNPDYLVESCLVSAEYTAKKLGVQLGVENGRYISRSNDDTLYIQLWADVQAHRHKSMNELRESFIQQLKDDGYKVVDMPDIADNVKQNIKQEYKAASTEIRTNWAELVATSPIITYMEYKSLKDVHKVTREQKASILKYEIMSFYGLDETSITPSLVLDDGKGLRKKVLMLSLMTDDEQTVIELDKKQHKSNYFTPDKSFFTGARMLRLKVLELLGIQDIYTYTGLIIPNKQLINWAIENKQRIYKLLNIKIRSDIDKKPRIFIDAILDQLGMGMVSEPKTIIHNGVRKQVRDYRLDNVLQDGMHVLVMAYKAARANEDILPDWLAYQGGEVLE